MQLTEQEIKFGQTLMLAVSAPSEELKKKYLQMASSISSSLTEEQRDLAMKGVECRLEYARRYGK